jgi:hypothetical protein
MEGGEALAGPPQRAASGVKRARHNQRRDTCLRIPLGPEVVWISTTGADDAQLSRDKADCLSRILAALQNQPAVFALCIRGKGWVMQETR